MLLLALLTPPTLLTLLPPPTPPTFSCTDLDLNGDGVLTNADTQALVFAMGSSASTSACPACDLNADVRDSGHSILRQSVQHISNGLDDEDEAAYDVVRDVAPLLVAQMDSDILGKGIADLFHSILM